MDLIANRFPQSSNVAAVRCLLIRCLLSRRKPRSQWFSSRKENLDYMKCYSILGVPNESEQETVRQAFLQCVKRFHPDSGTPEANADKFQQIETAYRKLQQKFHSERWSVNNCLGEYGLYYDEKRGQTAEIKEFDIKHTAPQHRQYLSYGGLGYGTPAQREKQYQKIRAATAVSNVYNHRISKIQNTQESAVIVKDKKKAKDIKTRYGIDRLVEDLIQESMARGDFDNLSGKGKPLSKKFEHHNPYVDLVTQKINQVMIENGFTPEWITLQREIRQERDIVCDSLKVARRQLGPAPLDPMDVEQWKKNVDNCRTAVILLNKKINHFNLVVPLLPKQMLLFDLEKEAERILLEGEHRKSHGRKDYLTEKNNPKEESSVLSTFSSLFGL